MTPSTGIVVLEGAPADIGRTLGTVWQGRLGPVTDNFFATMAKEGLEEEFLAREAVEWRARMRDFAPHMLVEMETVAAFAGVDAGRYAVYSALRYCRPERIYKTDAWLEPLEECTSFLAIGSACAVAANILHKNRDAAMVPQSVHIKQVAEKERVIGGGDVGDLGLCHALNDAGLAAKTNTGSGIETPLRHAICNTIVLRHLAEECTTCEQALARLQEVARARLSSNGIHGCIWLFADREVGLVVEETPTKLAWRFIEDDVDARQNDFRLPEMGQPLPPSKRYAAALSRMRELAGRVRPEDLNALGRSTLNYPEAICHDTTNSATTSVLPHDVSAAPWWEMAVGHPGNTLYLPMSPRAKGLPQSIVDGSFWELSARLHPHNRAGECPPLDFSRHEQRFRERFTRADSAKELIGATEAAVQEAWELLANAVCIQQKGGEIPQ